MIFASPALAWAAIGAASIPIILHLLLRRPRATPWGSNYLLQIAIFKIQRRRKFEKWFLLALRILAIGLVGLAAAGPFSKSWNTTEQSKERWIIIDDGATSAEITSGGLNVLEELKIEMVRSIQGQVTGDRFALVLSSTPARLLMEPTSNVELVVQAISRVVVKEVPSDIPAALELAFPQPEIKVNARQVEVWSGFRRGAVNLEQPLPATLKGRVEQVTLITTRPREDQAANQTLLKCSIIRSAGETEDTSQRLVKVKIGREGVLEQNINQVLFQNNKNELVEKNDVYWNKGSTENEFDVKIQLERGLQQGIQATIQEDAQPLDNKIFVSLDSTENPNVTILGRKSLEQGVENLPAANWILRAIESTGMSVQEADTETISIRPPTLSDTVILTRPDLVDQAGWSWLQNYAKNGGILIITPASDSVQQNWAADIERLLQVPIRAQVEIKTGEYRLSKKQPRIGPLSLLGAELDALCEPIHIQKYLALETTDAAAQSALLFENGNPMVCWAKPKNGSGIIVVVGVSPVLSWSDLPVKPLMVPFFQELIRGGRLLASEQQEIQTGSVVSLGSTAAGGVFIPPVQSGAASIELDQNGQSQSRVLVSGLWTLQTKSNRTQIFAVNLSPTAASIQPLTSAALQSWFGTIQPIRFRDEEQETNTSTPWGVTDPSISGTLFLVALLCALAESILSRRGSPNHVTQPTGVSA